MTKFWDFLRDISSPRVKFKLAWITFAGLVLPAAFLMSIGFPEKYALPIILIAILPFQYAAFCLMEGHRIIERSPRSYSESHKTPLLSSLVLDLPAAIYSGLNTFVYSSMWLGVKVSILAAKCLPQRLLLTIFRPMADLSFYILPSFRDFSIDNLKVALENQQNVAQIKKIVRKSLRNFFRGFVEIGHALSTSPRQLVKEIPIQGREHIEAALARGKGVIILSARLGNFFLLGTRLAAEGYSTHVLFTPPRNERTKVFLDRLRLTLGQRTIYSRPRRQAAHKILQALRQNGLVIMNIGTYASKSGVSVSFFGHQVLTSRGPATLALRTGAAIIPAYLIRDPKWERLTLIIEPELILPRSENLERDVKDNTVRMIQYLERIVRSYPDQWNWMNIPWKGQKVHTFKPSLISELNIADDPSFAEDLSEIENELSVFATSHLITKNTSASG